MEFKELSIEERYDRLLDLVAMIGVISYALAKELGAVGKLNDLHVLAMKKMLPSYLSMSVKVMKKIAPDKTFKKILESFVAYAQACHSLSNIEVTWISDREAAVAINDCGVVKKMRDVVQKTGLDIDPRIWCKAEHYVYPRFLKEFGIDLTPTVEANGCRFRAKLK